MNSSHNRIAFWLPLALICVLGFFLVWYSTVWGAGLISDSFQYVASARSLASGQRLGYPDESGNIIPLTQYPPLFSVMLAGFEIAGVNGLFAARLLNATFFALNIGLVGISIHGISRSVGFSLFGALLSAVSISLVEAHAWVLSEPLFIFFSLLTFYWLGTYIRTIERKWLIASALTCSLAALTRYVGLALLLVALIVLLWKASVDRHRKWLDLGVYSVIGLLPLTLWSLRSYLFTRQFNNRSLQWIPLTLKNVYSLVNTIFTWFVPPNLVNGRERWGILVLIILFIGCVILLYWANRRGSPPFSNFQCASQPLFLSHVIFIPIYCCVVIFSKMLFDNDIGMTDRMFSPVLVSMIIPASSALGNLWLYRNNLLRIFFVAISLYLLAYFALNSAPMVDKFHRQGIGLARKTWHTSEVIQSLPDYASLPIYSNSPSTLYFWAGRMGSGVQTLEQRIQAHETEKAILVIFYHIPINNRINRLEKEMTLVKGDEIAKIYIYEP